MGNTLVRGKIEKENGTPASCLSESLRLPLMIHRHAIETTDYR